MLIVSFIISSYNCDEVVTVEIKERVESICPSVVNLSLLTWNDPFVERVFMVAFAAVAP